jgi:peroxiredoxin
MKKFMFTLFIGCILALTSHSFAITKTKAAPDFNLIDSTGKMHKLSDYKGKIVVLEWINFECPFVKKHYSTNNMQSLQKEYTDKGVVWLSICSSAVGKQGHNTPDDLKILLKRHQFAGSAYLIDADGQVGKLYGAKTTPDMFVINKDGNIVYTGAIDSIKSTEGADVAKADNYVKDALDEILAGKEVTKAVTVPYGCSVKY